MPRGRAAACSAVRAVVSGVFFVLGSVVWSTCMCVRWIANARRMCARLHMRARTRALREQWVHACLCVWPSHVRVGEQQALGSERRVHACVSVCICVCMRACVLVRAWSCACVDACAFVRVCLSVFERVRVRAGVSVGARACVRARVCVRAGLCVCVCVCDCECRRCVCARVC